MQPKHCWVSSRRVGAKGITQYHVPCCLHLSLRRKEPVLYTLEHFFRHRRGLAPDGPEQLRFVPRCGPKRLEWVEACPHHIRWPLVATPVSSQTLKSMLFAMHVFAARVPLACKRRRGQIGFGRGSLRRATAPVALCVDVSYLSQKVSPLHLFHHDFPYLHDGGAVLLHERPRVSIPSLGQLLGRKDIPAQR